MRNKTEARTVAADIEAAAPLAEEKRREAVRGALPEVRKVVLADTNWER